MKIDVTQPICDLDGNQISEPDQKLTLRSICERALLSFNDNLAADKKVLRYDVAMKIHKADPYAEITVEECALIKERIGEDFSPLVVGQTWSMLEAAANSDEGTDNN